MKDKKRFPFERAENPQEENVNRTMNSREFIVRLPRILKL